MRTRTAVVVFCGTAAVMFGLAAFPAVFPTIVHPTTFNPDFRPKIAIPSNEDQQPAPPKK